MKKLFVICCMLLFIILPSCIYAETILYLRSNIIIDGILVEKTDEYVKINFEGVILTYWIDEIRIIRLDDGTIIRLKEKPKSAKKTIPILPAEESKIDDLAEKNLILPSSSIPKEAEEEIYTPSNSRISEFNWKDDYEKDAKLTRDTVEDKKIQISLNMACGIAFFLIFTYVFSAYCLKRIALNANVNNSWFAWIPVMSFILVCELAGKPRWWAALFLLYLIPIVGPSITVIISVVLWIKIADYCGKPGWWGTLMLVPIVNYYILWRLAFSD